MSRPPVYIVLPTPAIGGAEKRFAGLWRHFQQTGYSRVKMVLRRRLFEALLKVRELAPLPEEHLELFDDEGEERWRRPLRATLSRLHAAEPDAVFHYVLVNPVEVQRFVSRRTLYTLPVSSLNLYNWKGRAGVYAAVLAAKRTDVLEERVMEALARRLPFRRNAMSVTPSSFVDLEYFQPGPQKRNRLVFTGLFSEEKQAFRLAEAIPVIDARLRAAGVANPEFRLLGRETRSPGVAELCARATGVDVKAWYEPDPATVLSEARVFFSLQRQSNYPSKALLEAMACGCVPVVTDVGTTRRLATEDFAFFVPRDFTAEALAAACVKAMTLGEGEYQARIRRMRELLEKRFSIETMAEYFRGLYEQLSAP
jgi:glycosyltransferase involved in cell wall biosynthesis